MIDTILQKYALKRQNASYRVLVVLIVLLLLTFSYFLSALLKPFILALFFAYALNPLVHVLERWRVPRALAVSLPILFLFILLSLIGYLFFISISHFLDTKLPFYENKIIHLYDDIKTELIRLEVIQKDAVFDLAGLKQLVIEGKKYIFSLFQETGSFLSNLLLFIFYLFFLLPGIKNVSIKSSRAFESKKAEKVNLIHKKIVSQIQQYIITKGLVSLSTGLLVYITGLIFGIDLALVWGVLAFILNFIPSIGSLIASIFPILLSILQFDTSIEIIGFSVTIISIQMIIGNIIEPKLFSKSLSLSSLVVFLSLIFWGWLWGIVGAILSVPIMAALSIVFQNLPTLRPMGLFLQSSFPIKEDQENLSLIYHMAYADKVLKKQEKQHIEEELKKEIYNPLSIQKLWKSIQKKPLTLKEIFADKPPCERIDLYRLACKIALLDGHLDKREQNLLHQIQGHYVDLSKKSILNIHELVELEGKRDPDNSLQLISNLEVKASDLEELAYSHQLLAKKYYDLNKRSEAGQHYQKAFQYYVEQDDQKGVIECSQMLVMLDNPSKKQDLFS